MAKQQEQFVPREEFEALKARLEKLEKVEPVVSYDETRRQLTRWMGKADAFKAQMADAINEKEIALSRLAETATQLDAEYDERVRLWNSLQNIEREREELQQNFDALIQSMSELEGAHAKERKELISSREEHLLLLATEYEEKLLEAAQKAERAREDEREGFEAVLANERASWDERMAAHDARREEIEAAFNQERASLEERLAAAEAAARDAVRNAEEAASAQVVVAQDDAREAIRLAEERVAVAEASARDATAAADQRIEEMRAITNQTSEEDAKALHAMAFELEKVRLAEAEMRLVLESTELKLREAMERIEALSVRPEEPSVSDLPVIPEPVNDQDVEPLV